MVAGIYAIRNTATGRVYIGSALDVDVRLDQHEYLLRRGHCHNYLLQDDWDNYGEEVFTMTVIEEIDEELDDEEYMKALVCAEVCHLRRAEAAGEVYNLSRVPRSVKVPWEY